MDVTGGRCVGGRCYHNTSLITMKGALEKENPLPHEMPPLGQCLKPFLHSETLQLHQLLWLSQQMPPRGKKKGVAEEWGGGDSFVRLPLRFFYFIFYLLVVGTSLNIQVDI